MKKTFVASAVYLFLGLAAGVFYREFTKAHNFAESQYTQLSIVHTHVLTLGFMLFLIVLILDKLFDISSDSRFNLFFWVYNAGLIWSAGFMAWHGVFTVLNGENAVWPASLSMAAGMGHIMLGLGLAFLMLVLGERVWKLAKRV